MSDPSDGTGDETISASEFKARSLELLDEVAESGKSLTITHVLIWLMQDDPKLSAAAAKSIQLHADRDGVFVPAIVCWEVAILVAKERIKLDCDVQQWLNSALDLPGFGSRFDCDGIDWQGLVNRNGE